MAIPCNYWLEKDIFYLGSLIHIVDSVFNDLNIISCHYYRSWIERACGLVEQGGWLTPGSPAVHIVNSLSDLTMCISKPLLRDNGS
jgi:hypothetical protein